MKREVLDVSEGTQERREGEEREGERREGGAVIGAEWPVERSYPQVLPAAVLLVQPPLDAESNKFVSMEGQYQRRYRW